MRANLEGGRKIYEAFRAWVRSTRGRRRTLDAEIMAGFGRVEVLYSGVTGDAIPPVPDDFDPTAPDRRHLATPYGVIFAGLSAESDPDDPNSLVAKMAAAADLIGIPVALGRSEGASAWRCVLVFVSGRDGAVPRRRGRSDMASTTNDVFIALQRDFQTFRSWTRLQVGEARCVGGHPAGPRFVYLSRAPVAANFRSARSS